MKTLTIVRHAKSSWEYDVSDRERPLKKRGITDALLVSKYLKTKSQNFNDIFSSPANRALTTCKLFLETLNISEDNIKVMEDIYDFGGTQLTKFIKSLPNDINHALIFGHNYALTNFVNTFGTEYFDNVPTCGLVSIAFNTESWNDIGKGRTIDYMFPKMLK